MLWRRTRNVSECLYSLCAWLCRAVSLYGDGYLRVASRDSGSDTDVLLSFRTSQPTALLLLAAGSNDFCAVSLDAGAVRARLDLGSGEASVLARGRGGLVFNDLQWHSVRLRRVHATLTLTVDGLYTDHAVTPGNFYEVRVSDRCCYITLHYIRSYLKWPK